MSGAEVPAAAVEAAAKASHASRWPNAPWDALNDDARTYARENARLTLKAAAPHMLSREREQTRLAQAVEVEADLDITFASDEQRRVFIELLESESGPIVDTNYFERGKAPQ